MVTDGSALLTHIVFFLVTTLVMTHLHIQIEEHCLVETAALLLMQKQCMQYLKGMG